LVGPLRALVVSNEVASDGMTTAQLTGLRYANDHEKAVAAVLTRATRRAARRRAG